jgi:hypothetical protein
MDHGDDSLAWHRCAGRYEAAFGIYLRGAAGAHSKTGSSDWRGGEQLDCLRLVGDVIPILLPEMLRLGVATAAEIGVGNLGQADGQ